MKRLIISGLAVILHCTFLNAQDVRTYSGRVTDSNGDGIEYVSIGVPNDTIFTVSDINGYFRFRLPDSDTRGIVFSHLSYDPCTLDPKESGPNTEGLSIILDYHELPEAVVLPDKGKSVTVLGKGLRWAGAGFGLSNKWGGILNEEWGSKVRLRKPTRIEKAELECKLEDVDKAVLSFVIYEITKDSTTFVPVQHIPVYQTILPGDEYETLVFEEQEVLLLDPGTYYFAIRFVEFEGDGALDCKGYFKGAYSRKDDFSMPLSIGLKVTGIEFPARM
jgi:hypothetical protein